MAGIRGRGVKVFFALSALAAAPLLVLSPFDDAARSFASFFHRWLLTFAFIEDGLPRSFDSLPYYERAITQYLAAWAAVLILIATTLAITWHFFFDSIWKHAEKKIFDRVSNSEESILRDSLREAIEDAFRYNVRPLEPFIAVWKLLLVVIEARLGSVLLFGFLGLLAFIFAIGLAGKFFGAIVGMVVIGLVFGLLKFVWDTIRWDLRELPKAAFGALAYIGGVVLVIWAVAQLPLLILFNAPALIASAIVASICFSKGHCGFGSFEITSEELAQAAESLLKNPKMSPVAVTRKPVIWV